MIVNNKDLDELQEEARKEERLRKSKPFHASHQSPCQRMLNALEPGTNVPVHRHADKEETYVLIRGEIRVLFFNESSEIVETIVLSETSDARLLIIPKGVWHSVEAVRPSIIFEVSDGPYIPLTDIDILKK